MNNLEITKTTTEAAAVEIETTLTTKTTIPVTSLEISNGV